MKDSSQWTEEGCQGTTGDSVDIILFYFDLTLPEMCFDLCDIIIVLNVVLVVKTLRTGLMMRAEGPPTRQGDFPVSESNVCIVYSYIVLQGVVLY